MLRYATIKTAAIVAAHLNAILVPLENLQAGPDLLGLRVDLLHFHSVLNRLLYLLDLFV